MTAHPANTVPYLNQLITPKVVVAHDPLRLVSEDFGDIYFSVESGLDETELVFIDGNDLIPRMKAHGHEQGGGVRPFVIAETGFGTGLNFLAVLRAWRQLGDDAPLLHFISTEIAPLPSELISDVLGAIPEVADDAKMLADALPPIWPGRHRRHFCGGKVTLDLLYGDCRDMLAQSMFQADAWFLDGFAPAKNAEMWQDDLYVQMARLSAPGATAASFTAAGDVRRGMTAAGFEVTRLAGFGQKRHRITAVYHDNISQKDLPLSTVKRSDNVVVIGAGIAGAAVAAALMRHGITPLVIGRGDGPHDGASGNIAAVQSPRLTAMESFSGHLSMAGFGYARWLAKALGASLSDTAVIYGWNEREEMRQGKILAQGLPDRLVHGGDAEEMRKRTSVDAGLGGLIFPEGGAVDPRKLTTSLLDGAETKYGAVVVDVTKDDTGEGRWRLRLDDGSDMTADHVVLAGGSGLAALTEGWLDPILPFQVTAGRVSHIPKDDWALNHGQMLAHLPAMSFGGYLAQADDGQIALGATFDKDINADLSINKAMHERNLALLPPAMRRLFANNTDNQNDADIPNDTWPDNWPDNWSGRLSYRIAAKDRQPIAGKIGDGLYILTALGARGMVTGPILGAHVAAVMCGAPSPLDLGMASVIDPFRFSAKAGL